MTEINRHNSNLQRPVFGETGRCGLSYAQTYVMSSPRRWSFDVYSRGQQIVLAVLVGCCVVLGLLLKFYAPEPPYYPGSPELRAAMERIHPTLDHEIASADEEELPATFTFNPNTVSEAELQQLGLSAKQAKSWINYRAGQPNRFKQPADIAKLYVLKPTDVERLLPLIEMTSPPTEEGAPAPISANNPRPESFSFDPNTVSQPDLQRLGLSPKQATSFIKYRDRLSRPFQSADELDKIRILNDDQKTHLKRLARIAPTALVQRDAPTTSPASNFKQPDEPNSSAPTTYGSRPATPKPYNATPVFTLDINTATALDLEQIPGIGPYWAKRLLTFRDQLGGFVSIPQIGTTYGLPDSTFQGMLSFLEQPGPVYRKLAVNLLTTEELKSHPYLGYKLANIMVKFREQNGPFKSMEDLRRIRIFDQATEKKLAPYLDFRQE